MKTIIAGTDFSASSINACKYAALLAKRLNCRLTLFNLFDVPLLHSNIGIYGITYDGLRKTGEQKMSKLTKELNTLFPDLSVTAFITNGSFREELELFTQRHQVEAVVMGLGSKNKISKFIYGSHGTEIAGKINAPVIIVPDTYTEHRLKSLLLAVDNTDKLHKTSLKGLERMLEKGKLSLKALHVRTEAEVIDPAPFRLDLNGKKPALQVRRAKNLNNGLKNYCRENAVDMVVAISKKHSVFYNFFRETHTKKLIFASRLPVMCIHE